MNVEVCDTTVGVVILTLIPLIKSTELPHWMENHDVSDAIVASSDGYHAEDQKSATSGSD